MDSFENRAMYELPEIASPKRILMESANGLAHRIKSRENVLRTAIAEHNDFIKQAHTELKADMDLVAQLDEAIKKMA